MAIMPHTDESAEEFCLRKAVDCFAIGDHEAYWTVVFMKVAPVDTCHDLGVVQSVGECRISRGGTVDDTKSVVFVIEAKRCDSGGLVSVHTAGFYDFHPGARRSEACRRNDAPLRPCRKNRGEEGDLSYQERPPPAAATNSRHD
jgi:hypothetical protein